MDPSNPLLRFEPGLLVWEIGAFIVLLLVVRRIAWNRLLSAMDEREKRIREAIERAQKSKHDATRVLAEIQGRTDETIQKCEQIIQQGREQAEHVRQQIVEEARAGARRITELGLRRLETERRSAMQEIYSLTSYLALQAAARLIQTSLDERQQRELVDQFLKEVSESTAQ